MTKIQYNSISLWVFILISYNNKIHCIHSPQYYQKSYQKDLPQDSQSTSDPLVVLEAIISYMASEKVVVNLFVPGEIFQADYFVIVVPNEIFPPQIEKGI